MKIINNSTCRVKNHFWTRGLNIKWTSGFLTTTITCNEIIPLNSIPAKDNIGEWNYSFFCGLITIMAEGEEYNICGLYTIITEIRN